MRDLRSRANGMGAAAAEKHASREIRCESCGYGAVADRNPPRCPMCGDGSWIVVLPKAAVYYTPS